MSNIDKEWLQQKIADMEATRDEIPFGLDEDDSNTLAAMKLALASLEAEKEYKHHSVISEQLAHVLSSMDATDHQRAVISCAVDRLNNVSQLLQSSPSALLVPEILDYQGAKELYNYLMTEEETNATVNGWNACRAAMLQGADGNSPVIPDGWVLVPIDPTPDMREAYHQAQAEYEDVDGLWSPDHQWQAMHAAAPEFREIVNSSTNNCRENAETSTKCWCHTCRPVTFADSHFVVCPDCGNKRCPHANDHRHACTGSNEPGQEGSAYTAAPQQEVKP